MSAMIVDIAVVIAQMLLGIAMLCTVYRMVIGPRAQDRILALDAFYITAMLMLVTVGMRSSNSFYFTAALIIGMLGFVSTVALAKFLMRGEVIE